MFNRKPVRLVALSVAVVSRFVAAAAAPAQEPEADPLVEILQAAKPAPTTARTHPRSRSATSEDRQVAGYDLRSGETSLSEGAADPRSALSRDPGFEPHVPAVGPSAVAGDGSEAEEGGLALRGIIPTPPTPRSDNTGFPWVTIYKLLMRFDVGGTDYFYVCSAWSANDFQLITAGHCIFNQDPDDDGNTSDARWADEVWAWAGQGDLVSPVGQADRPRGVAKATYLRSYVGWTTDANIDYDMGAISLDRRTGQRTGWMGRESNTAVPSLNFSGYPTETPFVPAGTLVQYQGYDTNNVDSVGSLRIFLDAFTYGGHSGGPSWRYANPDRWVNGIHSTSDRMGSAADTFLTGARRTDINDWAAEDETARPPVVRPDVIENFFEGNTLKSVSPNSAEQTQSFSVEYNVTNTGFADTGTVSVDFYLSTNDLISTADTYLGTRAHGSIASNSFINPTATFTAPASLPPGTYYVGWIVSTTTPEYGGSELCNPGSFPCDNRAVIGHDLLSVATLACTPDGHEPDNTSFEATTLVPSVTQAHSVCPFGDDDWMRFTLSEISAVTLETSGPSGDTVMTLYDGGLAQLELDDDDGPAAFSRIERTCGVDALAAGTYFVEIVDFGDNSRINAYDVSLTATACPVFSDGFESGNTSAWSVP